MARGFVQRHLAVEERVPRILPIREEARYPLIGAPVGDVLAMVKGSLSWDGEAGSALLEQIAKTIDRGETGWVAVGEMRKLRERLREPESAAG